MAEVQKVSGHLQSLGTTYLRLLRVCPWQPLEGDMTLIFSEQELNEIIEGNPNKREPGACTISLMQQ